MKIPPGPFEYIQNVQRQKIASIATLTVIAGRVLIPSVLPYKLAPLYHKVCRQFIGESNYFADEEQQEEKEFRLQVNIQNPNTFDIFPIIPKVWYGIEQGTPFAITEECLLLRWDGTPIYSVPTSYMKKNIFIREGESVGRTIVRARRKRQEYVLAVLFKQVINRKILSVALHITEEGKPFAPPPSYH